MPEHLANYLHGFPLHLTNIETTKSSSYVPGDFEEALFETTVYGAMVLHLAFEPCELMTRL